MTVFEMNDAVDSALKMDVYAIYLRKSRSDDDSESTEEVVQRHKDILTNYAARKGLYIGEIYEEVVSGETIEARPEIQRLIEDCYAGKYRGILVVEVTRLSRGNQGDMQTILDCLKYGNRNKGILVVTPTKTYDVAHNSDDEEYMEFELFMSRREYKMIQKRMDRGRKQAVVEGNFMGSYRPYGYDIIKGKKLRTLAPNPDEAPVVKLIFEWTVKNNLTAYDIAKRLTALAVPTYSGDPEWSRETIKTILTNPTYIGKVRWNDRMQVKTMKDGQLVKSRPRSNHTDHYMEFDGKHDGLIDEETFYAVSTRFKSDKTKANLTLQNPLAGLLVCANCGKAMAYQGYNSKKGKVAPRYIHRQSTVCKVKSATASDVTNALTHCLKLFYKNYEEELDGVSEVDESNVSAQIELMNTEIRKTERKLLKLFDAWENEDISNNEFVKRKAVHNERIASLKQQIEEVVASIPEREELQDKMVTIHEGIEVLLNPDYDAETKNRYLKRFIDRIEFSRENEDEFILDVKLK